MIKHFFILIGIIGTLCVFSLADTCLADNDSERKKMELQEFVSEGPPLRSATIPYQVFPGLDEAPTSFIRS